ncbi:MAG: hypothetical protein IOC90_10145 [Methylocystis sp.]|nr:hypothetical protein [Methylocystis sp.]MCA3583117.1 hypothetical protein [Methylocystis sp.]MCA3588378.1 hypothetical protein [Methylocystis sp.]MCA3593266.1 hypothetical protein [Methylocystis sp.]
MGFTSYVVPTLIPSLIAGVIALFIVYINRATTLRTHKEKFEFDKQLAELKFEFDKQATLDRAKLERQSADRRRRQELAEELLSGFYEARDAMKSVRSPFGHSGEGSSRTRDENETAEEKRKKIVSSLLMSVLKNIVLLFLSFWGANTVRLRGLARRLLSPLKRLHAPSTALCYLLKCLLMKVISAETMTTENFVYR